MAPSNKQFQPVFHRFGTRDYVETGSTGTDLTNYGVSLCGAGTFTLRTPAFAGQRKTLILTSSDAVVQTDSSASVFSGSSNNSLAATTDLDVDTAIDFVGKSTAAWYLASAPTSGWAAAATTQA